MRALCFVRSEPKDNGYARPIDSMVIVVDLYKMEVIRIEEYPIAPLPPEPRQLGARIHSQRAQGSRSRVEIVQPEGPSFTVDGNQVEWQKWKFRVGFTSREGLVLHTVSYDDDGVERPILYRASICEMVVPYGDPGEQYYRKNAFDIGEYGLGHAGQLAGARVRLSRRDPLLRFPSGGQPRQCHAARKMRCACMRKISAFCGSTRIGEPANRRCAGRAGCRFLLSPRWGTMSMDSIGISIRTDPFSARLS